MPTDAWGIDDGWLDADGAWRAASTDTIDQIRESMGDPDQAASLLVNRPGRSVPLAEPSHLVLEDGTDVGEITDLPPDLPLGIHELVGPGRQPPAHLLVSPGRCHLPSARRLWGVALQVPTTRSRQSWGIGDLTDVGSIAHWLAGLGAGLLALSPLHAPTPVAPIASSPYYPSSRRWFSPLLIRPDALPGGSDPEVTALHVQAQQLLDEPVVDRDSAWALQRSALEHIWGRHDADDLADAAAFLTSEGSDLERWARFCALAERYGGSWRAWPDRLRHPRAPAVAREADSLKDRVLFHAWLQLLVRRQLDVAEHIGPRLVHDLAVGADPDGADSWAWQDLLAFDFSIGAPPDQFVPDGQSWGLPPWVPWRLRHEGYQPLAGLLRACVAGGGGLRIDHVMGLTRLFWVPAGGSPADGAYVRFEGRELLDVVAMESARAGAIVIGEDLGTVEPGFREMLTTTGIHSTRLVWFEDEPPGRWPEQGLAMVTTHDLPTLAGIVSGDDAPPEMVAHLEGIVGPIAGRTAEAVALDIHERLAGGHCALVLATMEDLLGVVDRPNRPGTTNDTNWSVAAPTLVEDLPRHRGARAILDALGARSGT